MTSKTTDTPTKQKNKTMKRHNVSTYDAKEVQGDIIHPLIPIYRSLFHQVYPFAPNPLVTPRFTDDTEEDRQYFIDQIRVSPNNISIGFLKGQQEEHTIYGVEMEKIEYLEKMDPHLYGFQVYASLHVWEQLGFHQSRWKDVYNVWDMFHIFLYFQEGKKGDSATTKIEQKHLSKNTPALILARLTRSNAKTVQMAQDIKLLLSTGSTSDFSMVSETADDFPLDLRQLWQRTTDYGHSFAYLTSRRGQRRRPKKPKTPISAKVDLTSGDAKSMPTDSEAETHNGSDIDDSDNEPIFPARKSKEFYHQPLPFPPPALVPLIPETTVATPIESAESVESSQNPVTAESSKIYCPVNARFKVEIPIGGKPGKFLEAGVRALDSRPLDMIHTLCHGYGDLLGGQRGIGALWHLIRLRIVPHLTGDMMIQIIRGAMERYDSEEEELNKIKKGFLAYDEQSVDQEESQEQVNTPVKSNKRRRIQRKESSGGPHKTSKTEKSTGAVSSMSVLYPPSTVDNLASNLNDLAQNQFATKITELISQDEEEYRKILQSQQPKFQQMLAECGPDLIMKYCSKYPQQ